MRSEQYCSKIILFFPKEKNDQHTRECRYGDRATGRNGVSDKKKEAFYLELNILVAAGVDIRSSLEIIEEEQTVPKEKELYKTMKRKPRREIKPPPPPPPPPPHTTKCRPQQRK